jgi:small-conductance mechanosensitive channel
MSTFRIYDAPAKVEGDSAVFEIGPADAAARYPLNFRRSRDGRWMLLVESETRLRSVVGRFLDDLGYVSIEAMQNARRNSPRGAMRAFLTGVNSWEPGNEEKVLAHLDLSFLPVHLRTSEGLILADYLKQIIDRAGFVVWQEIPNDPSRPTPYTYYRHPVGNVTINRVAVSEEDTDRWLFSVETLKTAPELFDAIQDLPLAPGIGEPKSLTHFFQIRELVRTVSPKLLDRTSILENWQWLGLIAAFFLSTAIAWTAGRLSYKTVYRMLLRSESDDSNDRESGNAAGAANPLTSTGAGKSVEGDDSKDTEDEADAEKSLDANYPGNAGEFIETKARAFAWPLKVSVAGLLLIQMFEYIGIVHESFDEVYRIISLITAVGLTLVLYRFVGLIGQRLLRRAEATPSYVDEIVTSLATGLVKLAIVIMGIVVCAEIVELPYEGVITGLGIGGVALAFASRETVSNMLGGALLMTDRPFKRGDLVETDGQRATVVNVGLRSTRLRRLDDTIMIIPNAQLSDKAIINWGIRKRRRIDLSIGLTYATPRKKLDRFVKGLKELFKRQRYSDPEDCYIGLKDFGASAIEIEFRGFFRVYSYGDQVRVRHALVGEVITLAEEIGVSFAFPTRTVHLLNAPTEFEGKVPQDSMGDELV